MMTFQSKPSADGAYRIKVLDQNLYIESAPGGNPGLRLCALSESNDKQKWRLVRVPGQTDVWTIVSLEDKSGLGHYKTSQTYWGYGYPLPRNGPSEQWLIQERSVSGKMFSKIKLNGSGDPFDSCDPGSDAVNFYYDNQSVSAAPKQCYVFEHLPNESNTALDIIFLQDATGSQQPYIDNARAEINQICTTLATTGSFAPGNLRIGLVAFRDHPPQDNTFVTQYHPLTSDVGLVRSQLSRLAAHGGGDGPEAQSDAMAVALTANWRDDAVKIVILITDAPPHGIRNAVNDYVDMFPNGCPQQNDPLHIANRFNAFGITLHVVACEPTLSTVYKGAKVFYEGLTRKTGGQVFPLGDASSLSNFIIGSVTETIERESLVQAYQQEIRKQAEENSAYSIAEISEKVHSDFVAKGVQLNTFVVEDIYESNDQAKQNAQVWFESDKLADAKPRIQEVAVNSIAEKYRHGGQQATELIPQTISLAQVHGVVQRSLAKPF
ncbi:hypothetical protein BJ138DRAFT_750081 [Hygrophoropsis aurantiaca]|uniref:Uncharacterized protein n=1 Tax=Hygrophoropsis aurantiaca TaxID=72124 RepID=A0ACB8AHS1_9AGAM|nr:hypothetical protein BJ138DRAFT_750081 [Hygrophoropsis aurantiaca]